MNPSGDFPGCLFLLPKDKEHGILGEEDTIAMAMNFKQLLGTEGPLARFGNILFDMLYINLLWALFGGPVLFLVLQFLPLGDDTAGITIFFVLVIAGFLHMGTSTAAAYAAMGKKTRKEDSYTFPDFWKSFRQNYKQGLVITIVLLLLLSIVSYAVWLEFKNAALFGRMLYVLLPVQGFFLLEILFVSTYIFALLARFDMRTGDFFKYAFMMANKHLPTTLLCVLILGGILAATLLVNLGFSLFAFGLYFYLTSLLLERVFKNYMGEEAGDARTEEGSEEEQAAEEEFLTAEKGNPKEEALGREDLSVEEALRLREQPKAESERQKLIDKYSGKFKKN